MLKNLLDKVKQVSDLASPALQALAGKKAREAAAGMAQSLFSRGRETEVGPAGQKEGVRWAVAGMATLLTGQKVPALTMFGRGFQLLERRWHEVHPEFEGGFRERVQASLTFYEATHQNRTNRTLHVIGIPMIVGGAAGLLVMPALHPAWWASAGLFTVGWQLNIAGHMFFEKNRPAFADDPLSFVVGPLWDAKQLAEKALPALARLRPGRRASTAA